MKEDRSNPMYDFVETFEEKGSTGMREASLESGITAIIDSIPRTGREPKRDS